MGIKFDILTDMFVLNEASEFSKFFTSVAPVNTIHKELNIDANVKLVLVPSENRHDLWVELRNGKAIFGVINNKREFIDATFGNLMKTLQNLGVPPNRARTYNEIKSAVERFGTMVAAKEPSISAGNINVIRNKVFGRKQSHGNEPTGNPREPIVHKGLIDMAKEIWSTDEVGSLELAFKILSASPWEMIW